MKERPILSSAPMVRALLAGTKTQTRRVVKYAAPDLVDADGWPLSDLSDRGAGEVRAGCPYGQLGDRLWVREAWRTSPDANAIPPRDLHDSCVITYEADDVAIAGWGKYRPGMFMPRWASRITLEIVSVRQRATLSEKQEKTLQQIEQRIFEEQEQHRGISE